LTQRNIALDILDLLTPLIPEQTKKLEKIEGFIEEKEIKPLIEELNAIHHN